MTVPVVLTKPLAQVSYADLVALCQRKWPEGEEVDYKTTLPAKGGDDPWFQGEASDLGHRGRLAVLELAVGFANTNGGSAFLGIAEITGPPRASAISEVPRCAELARVIEDLLRTSVDPPLPSLQVHPILAAGTDKGVVILRIPRSARAPHRVAFGNSRDAFVRRGSSTVPLTMTQISEMARDRAHERNARNEMFAVRQAEFHQWLTRSPVLEGSGGWVAVRATVAPTAPLTIGRLTSDRQDLDLVVPQIVTVRAGRRVEEMQFPIANVQFRPVLRGIRWYSDDAEGFRSEAHQDGHAEMLMRWPGGLHEGGRGIAAWYVDPRWVIVASCNAMRTAFLLKDRSEAGPVSYELQIEIVGLRRLIGAVRLVDSLHLDRGWSFVNQLSLGWLFEGSGTSGVIEAVPLVPPHYPIEQADQISTVANGIFTDLRDAAGDTTPRESIEFTI